MLLKEIYMADFFRISKNVTGDCSMLGGEDFFGKSCQSTCYSVTLVHEKGGYVEYNAIVCC